jgi:hypothetical protein
MPVASCLRPKPASSHFEIGYAACYTFICICCGVMARGWARGLMLHADNRVCGGFILFYSLGVRVACLLHRV